MLNKFRSLLWKYFPLPMLKLLYIFYNSFRSREKLGLVNRPWYAYGLLSAADRAKKNGINEIWALEFGVATGRGLKNIIELSGSISKETGVKIHIAGFDTGTGMPPPVDYRDHPEIYREGDYPMFNKEDLEKNIGKSANLIIGDIEDTIQPFMKNLSETCPIGFVSVDVDTYSSTKSVFKLFESESNYYLPLTFVYFDDCSSRSHFNKFCGELLAIDEFNAEHELRKFDIDRGVWNSHRRIGPEVWYERMFILHIFDHHKRVSNNSRETKLIKGH